MNYVEDDVPLSDSLENKGLMRKAAAAAHDAAAMMKSLRKRTDAWRNEVETLSLMVLFSMKSLRQFLQSVVRQWFAQTASADANAQSVSALDLHQFLPPTIANKLSDTLANLMTMDQYSVGWGGEEADTGKWFLTHSASREALLLWGECIPLLYTSDIARSSVLMAAIEECTRNIALSESIPGSAHSAKLPSSETPASHKLKVLCRRLRVGDVLDEFVSKPIPFIREIDTDFGENDEKNLNQALQVLSEGPRLSSSLIADLGRSLQNLACGRPDAQHLYYALCHRYHTRVFLFDGFYAAAKAESDDRSNSSPTSKPLSSGDPVRVAAAPSSTLQFDSANCSDSIALIAGFGEDTSDATVGAGSVHQRASKVWGTVLSTHQFSPKTGVHRWAVRLDKCERGHVFIGVATAQASTRTYVGGDKYGWGMIGTQALWHDRRKIRGDYGSTFRTGSTIIVTLDSDAGTLSFSSWRDSGTSSAFSLDSLVQHTPKRSGQVGGTIENWGVAFEGLPLDAKLYPAVGLYQRDDRVTLLAVETVGTSGSFVGMPQISGGECYYPLRSVVFEKPIISEYASRLRLYNDRLIWDGMKYATETLQSAIDALNNDSSHDFIVEDLLPSLAASISLLPACVPVLSVRCALTLMPTISRCILRLDEVLLKRKKSQSLFHRGLQNGKWAIRASSSAAMRSKFEEYVVDIDSVNSEDGDSFAIQGSGSRTIGKSKHGTVKMLGCIKGSALVFIEDWSTSHDDDSASSSAEGTSSCVVTARLSLDGTRFDGIYRNVQYGSAGHIVGIRVEDSLGATKSSNHSHLDREPSLGSCGALLCLAQSHLATLLGDNSDTGLEPVKLLHSSPTTELLSRQKAIRSLLSKPYLSLTSLRSNEHVLRNDVAKLKDLYGPPVPVQEITKDHPQNLLANIDEIIDQPALNDDADVYSRDILARVATLDKAIASECGGLGSFRSLSPAIYAETRLHVIWSVLRHCSLLDSVTSHEDVNNFPDKIREQLKDVWRTSLKIMEDGVRKALSIVPARGSDRCEKACELLQDTSKFLLSLEMSKGMSGEIMVSRVASELALLYGLIQHKDDLAHLESEMTSAKKRGLLRLAALGEICRLISLVSHDNPEFLESLIVGLPRQLGRGKLEPSYCFERGMDDGDDCQERAPDLDGNYLFHLAGGDLNVKANLRRQVCSIYSQLGKASEAAIARNTHHGSVSNSTSSDDSFLISAISLFIGNLRDGDLTDVIDGSNILSSLHSVLSAHRYAINYEPDLEASGDEHVTLNALSKICRRDVSRAILRCAVAAMHVVTYQVSRAVKPSCQADCMEALLTEIAVTVPYVEDSALSALTENVARRSAEEWLTWCNAHFTEKLMEGSAEPVRMANTFTCLRYLIQNGTMFSTFLQGQLAKPLRISSNSPRGAESQSKLSVSFAHHLLTHLFDVACAALRSQSALPILICDKRWIIVVLKAVGLNVEYGSNGLTSAVKIRSHDDGILPARFRARLLRLLHPLLSALEPSHDVIAGLLHLAGVTSSFVTRSLDNDECFVSREVVSLLRQLHSPLNPSWREAISHAVVQAASDTSGDSAFFCKKVGLLAFLSGSIESLRRGSYVLLKPVASSSLSPDFQSSPSSKTHPSGIGGGGMSAPSPGATPHHLVGNGTSAVVAGLSMPEASAGIVSSIDLKNGICEVILVTRDQKDQILPQESNEAKMHRTSLPDRGMLGGRYSLTVRALRTPLIDTIHAQEVPLFLDTSISFDAVTGSMLKLSLESLLSAVSLKRVDLSSKFKAKTDVPNQLTGESVEDAERRVDGSLDGQERLPTPGLVPQDSTTCVEEVDDSKSLRSGVLGLAADLMTIRCCVVLLSDKRILATLNNRSDILSRALALAWPDDSDAGANASFIRSIRAKGLSSLPMHEASFSHLTTLLRDLNVRMLLMKTASSEQQEGRMQQFQAHLKMDSKKTTKLDATTADNPLGVSSRSAADMIRTVESMTGRSISHSTGSSNSDDEEESEAAATAAAHLREAAIAQMSELGLPRAWSELALRKTGGVNIEAAVTFCLERGSEIERMLAEEQENDRMSHRDSVEGGSSRGRRHRDLGPSNRLLRQLLEMGFPKRWCAEALAVTGNDVDEALTWILNNGERLSEEDEAMEGDEGADDENGEDADSADEEDEEETEGDDAKSDGETDDAMEGEAISSESKSAPSTTPSSASWSGSVIPVRFISGRAIVDPSRMEISGLPAGGLSSVGTKGVLLTSGKWYYEAVLETAGCLQIGWADGSFAGHCHADRGDGCGDGPSSWAFDGWRRYRWHATATEWGCRWKQGDVVGCLVDMDERVVSFTLNGKGECIGMGVAFTKEGFRPCGGVYACVSFNRREKLRFILGGPGCEPFKYQPPAGYRGVGEAVLEAVEELDHLLAKENVLEENFTSAHCGASSKRFLCDFSDGDHGHELMAWAHRYYGSDASVHLGSSRSKHSMSKSTSDLSTLDMKPTAFVTRRLRSAWSELALSDSIKIGATYDDILARVLEGYDVVQKRLTFAIFNECLAMGVLLCRKLLLHVLLAEGQDFNPDFLTADGSNRFQEAVKFWNVLEACTSLRSAGWVGEAGAMAISAEAVGLGISSNENSRATGHRPGVVPANHLDEGLYLPTCGFTQLLSSVRISSFDANVVNTCFLTPAYAEAALGSEGGGGILSFLQFGLQSAVCLSTELRIVLVAATRRAVRRLAVVEYEGDDFDSSEPVPPKAEESSESNAQTKAGKGHSEVSEEDISALPDARLAAFVTGLLLSKPVKCSVDAFDLVQRDLFEAWSIGLLSASLPWRMICALTAAGILKQNPEIFAKAFMHMPTLTRYFGRLQSTVARRLWAERAAVPVCSRYAQAMVELLASVETSVSNSNNLSVDFLRFWGNVEVDASTPLPICPSLNKPPASPQLFWEADEGWVSSDCGWEVWTGTVEFLPVEWKTPALSSVRTLMDGGDGPPMLLEGNFVMRGVDWDQEKYGYDDGKDAYDQEKAHRDAQKKLAEKNDDSIKQDVSLDPADSGEKECDVPCEKTDPVEEDESKQADKILSSSPSPEPEEVAMEKTPGSNANSSDMNKHKKIPSPKLPIGTILAVEAWNGIPAMARRVKWSLTGKEGVYRFGGDGGLYDLCHVEVNSKGTRVKKRHPLPESAEQCAARHGFGARATHSVLLRLRRTGTQLVVDGKVEYAHDGVLEWPDFGAGVRVYCVRRSDGSMRIRETELLYGSKDSGWISRFGQPSFVPGCETEVTLKLRPENERLDIESSTYSLYEELEGRSTFDVALLRNPANGTVLSVTSEMRLFRGLQTGNETEGVGPMNQSPLPPPLTFDRAYHAPSLSLSRDGRTVSCTSSDGGRGTAFASMGFTKGIHYWEVKLEQADIGSVFIGVAEKPIGSGSGSSYNYDAPPRLNRWHGWGFVNFRATYTSGAERIFGSHCHAGDTVGVLLDCDAGRLSYFFDGLKYGEHILNDLGCAFENLSPFGFNVDGCGSGGAGQGAPSGFESGSSSRLPAQGTIRPRTLWPVVGLRNQGDRITLSSKWSTTLGVDSATTLSNVIAVDKILTVYVDSLACPKESSGPSFPQWFVEEAFAEYKRWSMGHLNRFPTRGSGPFRLVSGSLDVDFDASPIACASASAALGLREALLAGDRVKLTRSAGRILELDEEAVVLGAYQGRLYYRVVSQKSEGGSLTEGGGRAWCWDESEVVDELLFISPRKGHGVGLPRLPRFTCAGIGGLRVVYENGAVLRSDIEIFDGSVTLGTIPVGTVIPSHDIIDRRVNSCGVVRFRVIYKELGEGWISARIRGDAEDLIIQPEPLTSDESAVDEMVAFRTPMDCALAWHKQWTEECSEDAVTEYELPVNTLEEFSELVSQSTIPGLTVVESDAAYVSFINAISNFSDNGDALVYQFQQVASALSFALSRVDGNTSSLSVDEPCSAINQAAATVFASFNAMPTLNSILARIAVLRALNRRARFALPWMSVRPCQEGSAILGGLFGHGTSPDRAGRARLSNSDDEAWIQVPSIATNLRSMRGILFTSVKREFVQSIVDATTTPTPLSHDEYELPREIRTVRINRLKAGRAMLGDDRSAKRKFSVFAQLMNETKNWGGAGLRRGYVAKGHGGQKRAFKVKLIGEGVNDYSGPYREAFTDAIAEVVKVDDDGISPLSILDPSPNTSASIGENRDLFMFSLNGHQLQLGKQPDRPQDPTHTESSVRRSFASLMVARDESSREVEESLVFLGRLAGTAFRHGISLDLPLPLASVWKPLTEEPIAASEKLRELDELAYRQLENVSDAETSPLLLWQQRMLNAFAEGLGNVLPMEILPLLTGEELRDAMCGNPEVDVSLLQQVVEYEGYTSSDPVIGYFWETLKDMTNQERKQFLQFVWARNRLPVRESDFDAPFKIQRDPSKTDQALPSASTCFFTLTLPEYSSPEILRSKLLFAINNVTTMETDFQTNSAEIAEGYRAF